MEQQGQQASTHKNEKISVEGFFHDAEVHDYGDAAKDIANILATVPTNASGKEDGEVADVDYSELPSMGSALHSSGKCKPCAFLHTKGCVNGTDCQFCHLCQHGRR